MINRRAFLRILSVGFAASIYTPLRSKNILSPSLKFFVLGDWGTGGELQRSVAQAMLTVAEHDRPDFIISTGDNIYPNGVTDANDKQWKTKFETVYQALKLPWYPVLGNHDYRQNPDAQIEYGQTNTLWKMPARYYTFMPDNPDIKSTTQFFMLDTQAITQGSSQQQIEWLSKELQQSQAIYKIAVGHHPIRSYGHYGDSSILLKALKPLFDRYGVLLYLNGHEHDLQYIKKPNDTFWCLTSGGGGGSRPTTKGADSLFAASGGGFALIKIENRLLTIEFYDSAGKNIFHHTTNL